MAIGGNRLYKELKTGNLFYLYFLAIQCGLQNLNFLTPGIELGSWQWKHQVLPTGPPVNSGVFFSVCFLQVLKLYIPQKIDSDFSWSCSSLHKTSHRSLFAVIQSYVRTWDHLKSEEENHRVSASHSFLSFSLQPQLLKWRHDSEYLILLLSHSFPSFLRLFIPSPSYCLKIFYLV